MSIEVYQSLLSAKLKSLRRVSGRSASWSDPRSLAARRTNRHHARQPVVTTVLDKDLETAEAGADSSYSSRRLVIELHTG